MTYVDGGVADCMRRILRLKPPKTVPSFSKVLLSTQISWRVLYSNDSSVVVLVLDDSPWYRISWERGREGEGEGEEEREGEKGEEM